MKVDQPAPLSESEAEVPIRLIRGPVEPILAPPLSRLIVEQLQPIPWHKVRRLLDRQEIPLPCVTLWKDRDQRTQLLLDVLPLSPRVRLADVCFLGAEGNRSRGRGQTPEFAVP